jgi:3-oxoacyl-[acyl-carrier protein] reductase
MELAGRVAIVTGAGGAGVGGLGVVYAEAVAAEGAAVVIADIDGDAAGRVGSKLSANGARTLAVRCDVTSDEDILRMVDSAVDTFGRVDILVTTPAWPVDVGTRPRPFRPRTGCTSSRSTLWDRSRVPGRVDP